MPSRSNSLFRRFAIAVVCLGGLLAADPFQNEAHAKLPPGKWVLEYQVQVEYWFWDYDYYYWSTVYRTESSQAAGFVFAVSQLAMDNGNLNQLWPNTNWKFFAVDVRLRTVWKYVQAPRITASKYRLK